MLNRFWCDSDITLSLGLHKNLVTVLYFSIINVLYGAGGDASFAPQANLVVGKHFPLELVLFLVIGATSPTISILFNFDLLSIYDVLNMDDENILTSFSKMPTEIQLSSDTVSTDLWNSNWEPDSYICT